MTYRVLSLTKSSRSPVKFSSYCDVSEFVSSEVVGLEGPGSALKFKTKYRH